MKLAPVAFSLHQSSQLSLDVYCTALSIPTVVGLVVIAAQMGRFAPGVLIEFVGSSHHYADVRFNQFIYRHLFKSSSATHVASYLFPRQTCRQAPELGTARWHGVWYSFRYESSMPSTAGCLQVNPTTSQNSTHIFNLLKGSTSEASRHLTTDQLPGYHPEFVLRITLDAQLGMGDPFMGLRPRSYSQAHVVKPLVNSS